MKVRCVEELAEVPCAARCAHNLKGRCGTPSLFAVGEDGRCVAYSPTHALPAPAQSGAEHVRSTDNNTRGAGMLAVLPPTLFSDK